MSGQDRKYARMSVLMMPMTAVLRGCFRILGNFSGRGEGCDLGGSGLGGRGVGRAGASWISEVARCHSSAEGLCVVEVVRIGLLES